MPPSGMLILPGVRAEVTFYKGLLDKLGLAVRRPADGQVQGSRRAVDPHRHERAARAKASKPSSTTATRRWSTRIAADRRLKDYQVKTLLDQGLFTAATAKQGRPDRPRLLRRPVPGFAGQEAQGRRASNVVTNYKKKQIDTDFSGIGGLMKLMELFAGGKPAEKATAASGIAVVYAVGPIVEGKSTSDMFGEDALGSTTLVEALRKAADDPKVVAVVLRVDSPGGSATASDLIWREIVRCKKPVVASMGDVAGSGGYYIAMAARKIFAEPGTITGSIGVIGGKLVTGGLVREARPDDRGHQPRQATAARSPPASPSRPTSARPGPRCWTETYQQFVSKAAQGRKMNRQAAGRARPGPHLHRPDGQEAAAWSTSWARSTTPSPRPSRPPA